MALRSSMAQQKRCDIRSALSRLLSGAYNYAPCENFARHKLPLSLANLLVAVELNERTVA